MNKLLVICGPTATGKTTLALKIAMKFNGELISADSRQVYRYMDIVTGKDIPKGYKYEPSGLKISGMNTGFYANGEIKIWGYDLVRPDQEFSVKLYRDFALVVIQDILTRGKLPILVGGTGLFIQSVTEPMNKIEVPRDEKLRSKLNTLSVEELFDLYMKTNPTRAIELNNSEKNNPRRLIRKIEIDKYEKTHDVETDTSYKVRFKKILKIGLNINEKNLHKNLIDQRVDARVGSKLEMEISYLQRKDFLKYVPKDTIGYRQWIEFLNGTSSRSEAITNWKKAEYSYTKRQMTWFRKQNEITWFDVLQNDYPENVVKLVEKWHNT